MSKAALVAGADGVIIEVHFQPDSALSDGGQSLGPDLYKDFTREIADLERRLKA
jgi:3-deoxy-7-phosphoheptulonate synthase